MSNAMTGSPGRDAEFLLYQSEDGRTRVEVRFGGETAWLSIGQMAELFQRDKSVISRHLKNVFEEGELDRAAVVAESATTAVDGKTYQVEYYNLDVIISVGYREREYDRFTAARDSLPSSAEKHFEEAIRAVKQLEKKRRPTEMMTSRL